MESTIAIVGMACLYPDAASPVELWENVLAGRRAFRRIPPERLNLADYFSPDHNCADRTYATQAAVIEGYEFDRVAFRVAGSTFRAADLVHWLALDIADKALADAGFPDGQNLPKTSTGVILGNTLTGEFSRANTMRLRWPYVHRIVANALTQAHWTAAQCQEFLQNLEAAYKAPFPEVGAETLAGNLSNTIAGRICNHFDLQGGGYTVDGACSSSLLAITQACTALMTGDLDIALAGGVDLSLDPFELVGFAKAGALAAEEMRVYDARGAGFIPGEGCGFVVLMRYADAIAQQRQIYAVIRGWGISSDGHGGITRPEVEGQVLALNHAYRRANFGIETVSYFEGHGTGTAVGDATELQAISVACQQTGNSQVIPAVISSIKANIGHTKAAAGIAGLIKATMALHKQILPPAIACEQPHPELKGEKPALRILQQGQIWPKHLPLRAGVSAMGFGGINTHIVLEGIAQERRSKLTDQELALFSSYQDAELIFLAAANPQALTQDIEHLLTITPRLSRAEVTDLAAQLAKDLSHQAVVRAAIVSTNPQELTHRLEMLKTWLQQGITQRLDMAAGVFLGTNQVKPRIGFLFPGQGSPIYLDGGAWCRRFGYVQKLYTQSGIAAQINSKDTAIAQPSLVLASISALQVLSQLGITADVAVGHSLGELTALHWAGAFDADALLRIAKVRGAVMSQLGSPTGTMASIRASAEQVTELLSGLAVTIAGFNSPQQTVISGEAAAVEIVVNKATAKNYKTIILPVSHAFHSPLVASATKPFTEYLAQEEFSSLNHPVVSTVTGSELATDVDGRSHLSDQITAPVKFLTAFTQASANIDLWLEVGTGRVLSGLAAECGHNSVVSIDAGGSSLSGLLTAVAAAYVLGTPINGQALFADRFTRPFNLNWQPQFLANPCELTTEVIPDSDIPELPVTDQQLSTSALDLVRKLVAQKAELPPSTVKDDNRLLSDLHLNSITVGQLVTEAARQMSLSPSVMPTHYADATVQEVAQSLEQLLATGNSPVTQKQLPSGVDAWIRAFTIELVKRPLPCRQLKNNLPSAWQVIAASDYPLTTALETAFQKCPGRGIIVCLPPQPDASKIKLLLQGAKLVLAEKAATHFVLVQHGGGGAGFARTLYLERTSLTTCVIDVPINHPPAVDWIVAETTAAVGYSEAHYNQAGERYEPQMRLLNHESTNNITSFLTRNDVLLVTGGGKGIAAESALSLAKETGVNLALIGRSQPETDAELATNLQRMQASGINFRYISADVGDAKAVKMAVEQIESDLGAVTAVLHGAGVNVPKLISSLEETDFLRTLAPKVQGMRNVLAAIKPAKLKLLITFGSIIARTGLPGEADYALANEWLGQIIENFHQTYPHCRCLNLEWSIWSGVGMGERLGRVDVLHQEGITPIPPDVGISILHRLLEQELSTTSVVISGRFGETPTLKLQQPELPFWRFLEQPRVYYPGVELVADVEISADTDPYVKDHVFAGEKLLPGVIGLEAIAQVAMALAESKQPPIFQDIKFHRSIVIPDGASVKIRVAALMRESGEVAVVVKCEQTGYFIDHFQATCCFCASPEIVDFPALIVPPSLISLNPEQNLYGGLLFHTGRFRRLEGYRHLRANECIAEITPDTETNWFSAYLPGELVLGDPGAKDAAIHALQACIPYAIILPIAVEKLVIFQTETSGGRYVYAQERSHQDNIFIYDVQVFAASGVLLESWQGLKLQAVQPYTPNTWVEPLLSNYIQRRLHEFAPAAAVKVILDRDGNVERRVRSDRSIHQALGNNIPIWRRPDGKPEVASHQIVSAAHAGDLTLAIAGRVNLSCDLESVTPKSIDTWRDLLGQELYLLAQGISHPPQSSKISTEQPEDLNIAATRVWAAIECLQKVGAMVYTPLSLSSITADGWVIFSAGTYLIATFATSVSQMQHQLVLAVLVSTVPHPQSAFPNAV